MAAGPHRLSDRRRGDAPALANRLDAQPGADDAASFLVKHLLIDWRCGEQWFWDTLVDADYAQNGVNWQWVSGTGVDSNMFVRIMAPLVQSEKFDAAAYIREYVPELARLGDAEIHDPADNRRGQYPAKVIGHREGRERALAAYRARTA